LNSQDHGVNDHPELDAKLIRYADDFVLLCRPGRGRAMMERLKKQEQANRLTLNETKTRLVNFRSEPFRFFGFDFAWRRLLARPVQFLHRRALVRTISSWSFAADVWLVPIVLR